MSSLNSVSQIITIPFIPVKDQVLKFLNEVYQNILVRSNNIFNQYTFQEIVNLPMIIAEKMFLSLTSYTFRHIFIDEFTHGIYSFLFDCYGQKIKSIFSIVDFDNNSTVNFSDIFLILAHFHMIDNGGETIDLLKNVIEDFIQHDEEIDKEVFISRCRNTNCDVAVLMIFFINKYLLFFDEDEVKFFGDYCCEEYYDNKYNIGKDDDEDSNEMKEINVNISPKLKKYFDKTEMALKPRKSNVTFDKNSHTYFININNNNNSGGGNNKDIENNSKSNDEDDDFDELNNFEKDLTDVLSNPKSGKNHPLFDIQACKTFENNCNPLHAQNLLKITNVEKFNSKCSFSPKLHNHNKLTKSNTTSIYQFSYTKSTNEVSTNEDSAIYLSNANTNTINKLKASFPLYDNTTRIFPFPEFTLYQSPPPSNIQCKLIFTHSCCFMFTLLNNQPIYAKTIPLVGLFVKAGVITSKTSIYFEIKLISNIHNYVLDYYFYTISEEHLNKIKTLINRKSSIDSISDKFNIIKELGRGKFGQVYLIEDKISQGSNYAMKAVKKKCPTEEEYKINRWESSIFIFLTKIKHPNIIECFEYYETDENIYYIFEYVKGGDLKTYIKSNSTIPSETIVDISLQIINGVSCLHQYGIIHRDIKTTNILIERDIKVDEVNVKVIDFGLSRVLGAYEESTDPYGSLSFKAPELLLHLPYSFKVDIWAVGITIYYLIFKTLPYEKGTKQQIKYLIINKEINYPLDRVNSNFSSNYSFLFALIGECLEKNVNDRPDITHIMQKYYEKYQLEEEFHCDEKFK